MAREALEGCWPERAPQELPGWAAPAWRQQIGCTQPITPTFPVSTNTPCHPKSPSSQRVIPPHPIPPYPPHPLPPVTPTGERGIGGSKCGATAVNTLLINAPDGSTQLLTSNVGDARIYLIRNGQAICLTEEHVPDA